MEHIHVHMDSYKHEVAHMDNYVCMVLDDHKSIDHFKNFQVGSKDLSFDN